MKVSCDVLLTVMASSLYRLLGTRVANGYETAKSRHIFQDLVEATGNLEITERDLTVHLHHRAHNPLLLAAGFPDTDVALPWLAGKRLHFRFGS